MNREYGGAAVRLGFIVALGPVRPRLRKKIPLGTDREMPRDRLHVLGGGDETAWLGIRDSNSEMSPQIIPLKDRTDWRESSRILATEIFAFELRRWGNAARASCCRDLQQCSAPTLAAERHRCKARIAANFSRSKDAPPAATPATPLLSLRWTLSAKRACVVITDTEPDRLAPLAPPAPMGLRGVWVVAARCCAGTIERSVVCPSASRRGPVRHGLHPRYVRRRPAAGSPVITKRERTRNRRGCLRCCADRMAPQSPPLCAPLAGSRTRCAAP